MHWQIHKRLLPVLAISMLVLAVLSGTAYAWYPPAPGYQSYFQPYSGAPNPYYGGYGPAPGYYGYAKPRIYIRGRINRYGEYRMDMKLRGISKHDMYRMWLIYRNMRNQ